MIHTSFTFSDLLETFRDSISSDSSIYQLCQENFEKDIKVVLGHIRADELGMEDAPFLMITPSSLSTGMRSAVDTFFFDIDIGILEKSFEDFQENDVKEMKGFYLLDSLINLVIDNLKAHASRKNACADNIDVTYDISNFYPLHIATLNVSVSVETVLGFSVGIT